MAATGSPMPWVRMQVFDNNGEPAAGKLLFTYEAGTDTKITTYTQFDLGVSNTNPIVLDSAGRAAIYLVPNTYKFVLTNADDTDPPTSPIWTQDQVPALSPFATNLDLTGIAGEIIAIGDFVYLTDGSGGTTAGRWYKTDADQTYSSSGALSVGAAVSAAASAGDSFSIRKNGKVTGLSGLVAGTVYYASATAGALTSTAPTNEIVIGKADTTTSLVLGANWGDADGTYAGLVSTDAQTWSGVKTFNVQPQTYIGAATTLPATIAGVYVTDVTEHLVAAGSTDAVMSSVTIPANSLSADGKAALFNFGSSTATTGANNKTIKMEVAGTALTIKNGNTNPTSFWVEGVVVRIDSDSADFIVYYGESSVSTNAVGARINSLDFTTALVVRTLGSTGAASTLTQTFFIGQMLG